MENNKEHNPEEKKFEDNQPGMDQKRDIPNDDYQQTRQSAQTGNQGRTSFAAGSTTQGGSNHGQGSSHLAGDAYHQGDQKNVGSNYDNEKGEVPEDREDIPHGQGAHVNEKESNAQEDYPGTGPSTGSAAEPEQDAI